MVQIQKPAEVGILIVGLVLLVLGILLSQFWVDLVTEAFNMNLPLTPVSQSYDKWRVTPLPMYMNVYFWNWTNPGDVYQRGYVPSFVEVGPYVFREIHEKVNMTWNDNGTITFRTIKRWYFQPDRSRGSLADNITSVNVVAASASYMTRDLSRFILFPVSMLLRSSGEEIWWTKNVSQFLFDGFDNPIQTIGTYLSGFRTPDRFAWFYGRNGTLPSDVFNMGTGSVAVDEIGSLKYWNYANETSHYPRCRAVSGSTGEFWPTKNRKDRPLVMYSTDMCRQIRLYFEEEADFHGIRAFVYAGTKETVDNGTNVKENSCYCDPGSCPPSGVFPLERCHEGVPVFISYPHFYNADPSYRNAVRGMNPTRDRHRYFIKLEPKTGVQMEVAARMQINVYLTRNAGLTLFKNITSVYMPVLWLENHVALTDELRSGLDLMMSFFRFGPFVSYAFVLLGVIVLSVIAGCHISDLTSLSCLKKRLKASGKKKKKKKRKATAVADGGTAAKTKEENILYAFGDNAKEEVKYVVPEEKL